MDIGLREWLIIGGILVIVLILIDGWRRIRSGRSRIRMDIDRRRLAEHDDDEVEIESNQINPELPNGGARRASAEAEARAREALKAEAAKRAQPPKPKKPTRPARESRSSISRREPELTTDELSAVNDKPVSSESTSTPSNIPFSEMDPLFDDIPLHENATHAKGSEKRSIEGGEQNDPTSMTSSETAERKEPSWDELPSLDDEPMLSSRKSSEPMEVDKSAYSEDESEDDTFDPEQPIPVLMEQVDKDHQPTTPEQVDAVSDDGALNKAVGDLRAEPKQITPESNETAQPQPGRDEPMTAQLWDDEPALDTPAEGAHDENRARSWLKGLARSLRGEHAEVDQPSDNNESDNAPLSSHQVNVDDDLPTPTENDVAVSHSFDDDDSRAGKTLANVDPDELLVIFVVTGVENPMPCVVIQRIAEACGMEFGDLSLFHRYEGEDGEGGLQFSLANAVNPGTFELDNMEQNSTPAVTLFMSISEPSDPMYAYECMLATAETLAKHTGGELLDGDRSVMRPQTKEHYRERIRDVEIHRRIQRAR